MNKDTLLQQTHSGIPEYDNNFPSTQQFPYEVAGKVAKVCGVLSAAALTGMGVALYFEQPEAALLSGGVAFMSILTGAVASSPAAQDPRESYTELL